MYKVNEDTKRHMDSIVAKMRGCLFDLHGHMKDIEGLDPSSVGFIRHLATILDSGADIDHINMLGDTTYNNFCEELEIVENRDVVEDKLI